MNTEIEVVESAACRHCNSTGLCGNVQFGPGANFKCLGQGCRYYEPEMAIAVPEKLAVRQHRRLVSVDTAQALSHQYLRVSKVTNAALREMVVFGAMLTEIDKALTSQRFSCNGGGASLRSWLEANCPEIEYATAMDYKRTMKNFMAYKQLKEDTPLLELMNADPYDDEQKEALRRDILDSMTGLTKTQLRRLTDAKVGRPKGSKADIGRKPDTTDVVASARAVWSQVIVPADRCAVALKGAAKLLTMEDVENAQAVLQALMEMLAEREAELRGISG